MNGEARYVAKVRAGERPTEDEALAFLRAWHARHPAATSRRNRERRTAEGPSSYALLAACVPEGARAALDLACGDGELAALLTTRLGAGAEVLGIDASEEDLALARGRAPGARFVCADAQALPLADGSLDAVACHYALMLLRPLDAAVTEVARVLSPGGLFAAVVPGRWNAAGFSPEFAALVGELLRHDLPAFPDLGLGDPRAGSADGLRALFGEANGFAAATIEEHTLFVPDTPEDLLAGMVDLYWYDLLTPESCARLRREGLPMLERARRVDGTIDARLTLLLLRAHRLGE